MIPYVQAYKAIDYSNLFKVKIPDPIFTVPPAISASPPPGGDDKWNTVIYVALAVSSLIVFAGTLYVINSNRQVESQLAQAWLQKKKRASLKNDGEDRSDLLIDSKSNNNGRII